MGYVFIVLGAVIVGLVLYQLAQHLFRGLAMERISKVQGNLQLKLLTAQIEVLKEKHRELEDLNASSWNGFRKFIVKEIRRDVKNVASVLLAPHDGKKLPPFKPGQFLTFNLRIPGQDKPVIRCYSLSCGPNPETFRVTVKKVLANPKDPNGKSGLSSTYFNEALKEGEILDVKAPSGSFFLDLYQSRPVVLIGGGIGITPVFSMLKAIADRKDDRETWLFYGVRSGEEVVHKEEILELASVMKNLKVLFCYSDPVAGEVEGKDFQVHGRVSVDLFKKTLPSNNYSFYVCGPPPMMESITSNLKEWGVPDTNIFFEAFGFATVKKAATPASDVSPAKGHRVFFSRSKVEKNWDGTSMSLLELAEQNSISIPSGCRTGNCGTCLVAVKSGSVSYLHEPGMKPDAGTCLTCVGVPNGPVEIDA